ncbi:hypothetical protein TBS_15660 [Thermobispora bispora]|uniref:Uncharacterized protein n=1 Tax=Thermobispora bispora (strain ATCC 19993 / DSM 43833 / CBS 139.67 / JCM 10125 / KCTC 9307 / NBRC 14880 / R51) TaxID=469371 RepID=D6Y9R5_THEBD|nr:hypothetical protein [Thermobispora bispora]ADG90096.1 hypothetical protein Tbis_3406 [Thermobispora bispora DSM 43833]MBO2473145.1 hypothetical protein [Actinomycetales bacterium]MBX6166234.1 hypothetical protein [Thermobispora bispora]QSI46542.1 hypothetical protein CYL17_00700 [Thermobispora bispora]
MSVIVTDAEVALTDVLSLRLAMEKPLTEGARLVLKHRGTGVKRSVALGRPVREGRSAGIAVPLAPLGLTPGRWDAYLEQDGGRTRLPCTDPGFSLDRLDAYALERRTMAYRAYRTRNGYLAVKVDPAEPVADVRAVWLREGRFEATGVLAYTGLHDDDEKRAARITLHGGGAATVTGTATVYGVRFFAALSLCDVLDATPDAQGEWTPALEVEGVDGPLALTSRLDDVEGKNRRVHYPVAHVDGVPIRPYFTEDDELRLRVGP